MREHHAMFLSSGTWFLFYSHRMKIEGFTHLGYSDIGGHPEGLQVVGTGDRLFISHVFVGGFSEVDVSDPRAPRMLSFTKAPPGSCSVHLQVQGNLLLVANGPDIWSQAGFDPGRSLFERDRSFAAGMRVFDVSVAGSPRDIGFADVGGAGVHRIWFDGSPYAYVSAFPPGHEEGILVVFDLSDPSNPVESDRYWIPGMSAGEESEKDWPDGYRVSLHHPTVFEGYVYGAWRDGGVTVQPVSDGKLGPASRAFWHSPSGGGCAAHSAVRLPRTSLLAVAEEGIESDGELQERSVALFDVKNPSTPRRIGSLPSPDVTPVPGARFGPHNLYEYRPDAWDDGHIVFSSHQGAGLRAYSVSDYGTAAEVALFMGDVPEHRLLDPRPGRARIRQTNDCFVTSDGLVAVVDANRGLDLLQLTLG